MTMEQHSADETVTCKRLVTYEKELKAGSDSRSGSLRSQSKITFNAANVGQSRNLVSCFGVD